MRRFLPKALRVGSRRLPRTVRGVSPSCLVESFFVKPLLINLSFNQPGICNNNLFTQPSGLYKHSEPKIRRIHITSQTAAENGISLMQGQGMRLATSNTNSTSASMSITSSSSAPLTTNAMAGHRQFLHRQPVVQHHHNPNIANNSHSNTFLHSHKVVNFDYQGKAPSLTSTNCIHTTLTNHHHNTTHLATA